MDDKFIKFCRYHVLDSKKEQKYQELITLAEEYNLDFDDMLNKTKKYTNTLKRQAEKLGFALDFESFCQMLETYITKKQEFSDKQKEKYLVVLLNLSEIYDINLRAELEAQSVNSSPNEKEIFLSFCRYFINENKDDEIYNNLKEISLKHKINFDQLEKKVLKFIDGIKKICNNLGFDITEDDYFNLFKKYVSQKNNMKEKEKANYLKVLLVLSEIHNINLREDLKRYSSETEIIQPELIENDNRETQITENIENKKEDALNINPILKNFSNPLDNKSLLKAMLYQRYNFGKFEIRELPIPNEKLPNKSNKNFDYTPKQVELTIKLFSIFLDKYNNSAQEDLNPLFINILTEKDLKRLKTISKKDLFRIIKSSISDISDENICKKLRLSNTLLEFIKKSLETTNYQSDHIGILDKNLFNTSNEPYTIKIYINTANNKDTISFLNEYILKCIEHNLNYEMTNNWNNNIFKNSTILYANNIDFLDKIDILDKIYEDKPDLIKSFGTPLQNCSQINDSYYSVSHCGINNTSNICVCTYNDYYNDISEIAYYRILAKLTITKINDENDANIINNFISLNNIKFTSEIKNPLLALYNDKEFSYIKDIINKYVSEISNTLKIYMDNDSKIDILIVEFKKSLLYISNICQGRNKKDESNIAISTYMEENL